MKVRLVIIVSSFMVTSAIASSAQMMRGDDNLRPAVVVPAALLNDPQLASVLNVSSGVPRGPRQLLQDYEAEMTAITQMFGDEVAAIANAVHSGQLTSEQGQKISAEQYEQAQMQFELLSAWHEMLEADLARANQERGNLQENSAKPAISKNF